MTPREAGYATDTDMSRGAANVPNWVFVVILAVNIPLWFLLALIVIVCDAIRKNTQS